MKRSCLIIAYIFATKMYHEVKYLLGERFIIGWIMSVKHEFHKSPYDGLTDY